MDHTGPRAILVVALLVTTGCQGLYGSPEPPSDQRAVDTLHRAQQATHNISSYQYTIAGQVQIRRNSRKKSVAITGHGIVNVDRQQVNVTVRTRGDTRVSRRTTRVAYLDDYTLDAACPISGWARHNLTETTRWLNYTALGQQLALLDRTTVYWNGTEVVNGAETAIVTAYPSEEQLKTRESPPTGTVGIQGGANFENATMRAWINTETGRVRKVQRQIHVRGDEATGDATITYRFSEYNDPTNITRPSFEGYGSQLSGNCVGT